MSHSYKSGGPIANMSAIKSAIANNEVESLKKLLHGQALDKLQKQYLIELAQLSDAEVTNVVSNAEEKPDIKN